MKLKEIISKIKDKAFRSKYENKIDTKYFIIVGAIIIVVFAVFSYLINTYKEALVVNEKGYFISNDSDILQIKTDKKEKSDIEIVKVEAFDTLFKTPLNSYYDSSKKNTINIMYPEFSNDGLTLINYNEEVNIISNKFERVVGYKNQIYSYGKVYDSYGSGQIDKENYLFLSYQNGIYINLYDMEIETNNGKYYIPVNSFLYPKKDSINYYKREENKFVNKEIIAIDLDSKVNFYYDELENYEYTYERLLEGIGTLYKKDKNEEVIKVITKEEEQEERLYEEDFEISFDADIKTSEEDYIKPRVVVSDIKTSVYVMKGKIEVYDPNAMIVKSPTISLIMNGKTYLKRTYYGSGEFEISGLLPSTTFQIVGEYVYLDRDYETKKLVTFYSNTITTGDLSKLDSIKISKTITNIYSKKIEIDKLKITSNLKSETLEGIYKISIRVNDTDYYLAPSNISALLSGEEITVSTGEGLDSSSDYDYEIIFYDRNNNKLPLEDGKGKARTSKIEPSVSLKISSRDVDYVNIKITKKNPDNVELNNYRYVVYDTNNVIIKDERIEEDEISLLNLNPNQYYTMKVYANIDLDDNKGFIRDYELGNMEFTTVPLNSLGIMNLNVSITELTHESARIIMTINQRKTDVRLIRLTKNVVIDIKDEEDSVIRSIALSESELELFKNGQSVDILINNLESNKKYNIEIRSTSYQGSTFYEANCIISEDEFETTKIPAEVIISNLYTSNNLIDFDVRVEDVDTTILTNHVRFELRNSSGKIVKTSKIQINSEEERLTFNNLEENQSYTANFYADEYNETSKNETYQTKYLLKSLNFYTEDAISGSIELISSQRMATGTNLVDINSNTKWYETIGSGELHRTIDSDGMHLASKSYSAVYSYDLSEYSGKLIKVSFDAKVNKSNGYDLYVSNYLTGSSSGSYAYKIDLTNEFQHFDYTFMLGSAKITSFSSLNFYNSESIYYGKNRTNGIAFYINGGTANPSDYSIKNLQVQLYESEELDDTFDYELGIYDSNTGNKTSHSVNARVSELIEINETGYYRFSFNDMNQLYQIYLKVFNQDMTLNRNTTSYYNDGLTFYLTRGMKVGVTFRKNAGSVVADIDEMREKLNLHLTRYYGNPSPRYTEYTYDLVTRVKVNLSDVRDEITNDDYYIRLYDENNDLISEKNYVELTDTLFIVDKIKQLDLEENKYYKIELGVKIRDRYYALDSFEMTTNGEVFGIRNAEEFRWIQPYGNYVVLDNIDFGSYEYSIGTDKNPFNGSVDFQGYTMTTNSTNPQCARKFGYVGTSGVLNNLVLNAHLTHTTGKSQYGFAVYNYGTIENVIINVYDDRSAVTKDDYLDVLNYTNYASGVIRNFVINLATDIKMFDNSAILNYSNSGLIENGYVYGNNVISDTALNSNDNERRVSIVSMYGNPTGRVRNVYCLSSINMPRNFEYDKAGVINYDTLGTVENVYVVGDTNPEKRSNGPLVSKLTRAGKIINGYYMSDYTYLSDYEQKIFPITLKSVEFQTDILGKDNFEIDELMEFGYYPHVKFSSNRMPSQPYIELPQSVDNQVDIVNTSIISSSDSEATIEMLINNPYGEEIKQIVISDLDVDILNQSFSNGISTVNIKVYNPQIYTSKYIIRSITTIYNNRYESTRRYNEGDKYLFIDFYKDIYTVEDWISISSSLNYNYSIKADLDFYGYSNYFLSTFTGKIKGNNHTFKNIYVNTSRIGFINYMYGEIRDLNIVNFTKSGYANTINSFIGQTNAKSSIVNVHMNNVNISIPDTASSEVVLASLVGYNVNGSIVDSSAKNVNIKSIAPVSSIDAGGLVGKMSAGMISNSYVSNVNINVSNSLYSQGIGGLLGRNMTDGDGIIQNTYTTGKITSNNTYVGGIVGNNRGIITNSWTNIDAVSDVDSVGGIAGYVLKNTNVYNNLFVGSIFSNYAGGLIGRIAPNVESDSDYKNYAYSGSLINGLTSQETMNEVLLTKAELLQEETYAETISLGEEFNYDGISDGILPKLYHNGTKELISGQEDSYIYEEEFNIENINVVKHPSDAFITLTVDNPNNYIITDISIDDITVESIEQTNSDNKSIVSFVAKPDKYYDSYRLTNITYLDGEEEKTTEKKFRLDLTFYKELRTIADWQNISTIDAENYRLVSDIDFSSITSNLNNGVIFNRLETDSDETYYTLKNMNLTFNNNANYQSLISKVIKSMSNINFENITIENYTTSSNNYINLLSINYGNITNCNFKDITINTPNKNYISIIGRNEGKDIKNITLDNITITGKSYVASFVSQYTNSEGNRTYDGINASNLNITSTSDYTGGVFAQAAGNGSSELAFDVKNISVKDSTITSTGSYVGSVAGRGDCNFCEVDNVDVSGKNYVGGLLGYQFSSYAYENVVKNSQINGETNVGGLYGNCRYLRGTYLVNSTVEGTSVLSNAVGGISGISTSGYGLYRIGVLDSTISSLGSDTGGIIGYGYNGLATRYFYVNNTNVTGDSNVGGVIGRGVTTYQVNGIVGNTTVVSNNNNAGGIIGYVNNVDKASGYFNSLLIERTSVNSNRYAGGVYGKVDSSLSSPNDVYSIYIDASINSNDNITYGIVSGDDTDANVVKARQTAFYENSKINNNFIKNYLDVQLDNVVNLNSFESGFVDKDTGRIVTNNTYINASHTDFIKLDKDKTYKFNVNLKRVEDQSRYNYGLTFYVMFYDENKKALSTGGTNTNPYIDRYFVSGGYITEHSFRVIKDCYMRIGIYRNDVVESIDLTIEDNNYYGLSKKQLLTRDELLKRVTWSNNYTSSVTASYEVSKLSLSNDYFDFEPIKYEVSNYNIQDLSGNNHNGTAYVSSATKEGFMFDGVDDHIDINGFNGNSSFTVIINYTHLSTSNETLFYYGPEDSTSYGYMFNSSTYEPYMYLNGSGYQSYAYQYPMTKGTIALSYDASSKYLRSYLNGELQYSRTINRVPVTNNNYIARIGMTSLNTMPYRGIISSIQVFNRVLDSNEINQNYSSSSITNSQDLELYYDFTSYQNPNDSHYPQIKSNSIEYEIKNQSLIDLPPRQELLGVGRLSFNRLGSTIKNIYRGNLEENYLIYRSGIDTVNIEFNEVSDDMEFSYKNGEYESDNIKVENRVYSIRYDYENDIEFEVKTTYRESKRVLTKEELQRTIGINQGKYYYIVNQELYEENNKILDGALNIYDNLVLLKGNKIYNLDTNKYQNYIGKNGVLDKEIPLYSGVVDEKQISTYYNFSIIEKEGSVVLRDGQIVTKDNQIFIYEEENRNDNLVYNQYNNSNYQLALTKEGYITSYKADINMPSSFFNGEIEELVFDKNSNESVIMIKYEDGNVMVINYYNGQLLFEKRETRETLFKYISKSLANNNVSNSNKKSYKEANKLLQAIESNTNSEVKDKLSYNKTKNNNITNNYITYFNSSKNKYEVINTNELLDMELKNEEVKSEKEKIVADTFLYNYFYSEKERNEIKNNKIYIYIIILVFVLINLVLLGRKVHKNLKVS